MTLDVHIDRLILEGLDIREGRSIAATIERKLMDLVVTRGHPTGDNATAVRRLDAGTVRTTPSNQSCQIGAHIATAIYRGAGE